MFNIASSPRARLGEVRSTWYRRKNRVSVVGEMGVDVPPHAVLAVLWNIGNIELYEPKVDAVRVEPENARKGVYSASGLFAGFPWKGRFCYELTRRGFHSQMIGGVLGITVTGCFVARSNDSDACVIVHVERYRFPRWASPFLPLVQAYLSRAMRRELRNLARLVSFDQSLRDSG